jgi:RNA polymerase sigma-70 factor, ECF subfamily
MHSCPDDNRLIPEIEDHRGYLAILAQTMIERKLRSKIDAEDLVQEAVSLAYKSFSMARDPSNPTVIRRWLATILQNKLADERKKFYSDKRDIKLENTTFIDADRSIVGIEALIASNYTSPSTAAARNEQMARLADALRQLPDDQREVVTQKYLNQRTVAQIAAMMDRSPKSIAGLIYRGITGLRQILS